MRNAGKVLTNFHFDFTFVIFHFSFYLRIFANKKSHPKDKSSCLRGEDEMKISAENTFNFPLSISNLQVPHGSTRAFNSFLLTSRNKRTIRQMKNISHFTFNISHFSFTAHGWYRCGRTHRLFSCRRLSLEFVSTRLVPLEIVYHKYLKKSIAFSQQMREKMKKEAFASSRVYTVYIEKTIRLYHNFLSSS